MEALGVSMIVSIRRKLFAMANTKKCLRTSPIRNSLDANARH